MHDCGAAAADPRSRNARPQCEVLRGSVNCSRMAPYEHSLRFIVLCADVFAVARLCARVVAACGLTGTKLVCGEGGCGACTVLVSKVDHSTGVVKHLSVNACLYPLGAVDGAHIITVEGQRGTETAARGQTDSGPSMRIRARLSTHFVVALLAR